MSGVVTIEKQPPRTTQCSPDCRHPGCVAAERAVRDRRVFELKYEAVVMLTTGSVNKDVNKGRLVEIVSHLAELAGVAP